MPFDTSTISAQVKQDANAWRRDPTQPPSDELTAWLAHTCDVEDSFLVRGTQHVNKRRRAGAGREPLPVKRFTVEHAGLFVCCVLWDIDDEGRAPTDDEHELAEQLVRLSWVPKTADAVVSVPGAQERWDGRLR